MAIFEIEDDQGNVFEIEGPANATDQELQQAISQDTPQSAGQNIGKDPAVLDQILKGGGGPQQATSEPTPEDIGKDPNLLKTLLNLADKPEELAREGLGQIASAVPSGTESGNLALDVVTGAPKVAAETLAEVAPSFVSKESLAGGAIGKAIGPIARGIGKGFSKVQKALTGVDAKTFAKIVDSPSTLFKGVTNAASKKFGRAVIDATKRHGKIQFPVTENDTAARIVSKTLRLEKAGTKVTPITALEGRQAVDDVLTGIKKGSNRFRRMTKMRNRMDKIVKSDKSLAEADKTFSQAKAGKDIRQLLPVSKGGEASVARTAIAGVTGAGFGPVASAAFSPLAQGVVSGGLGLLGKVTSGAGQITGAVSALISELIERRQ